MYFSEIRNGWYGIWGVRKRYSQACAHATDDGTGAAGFDLFENENVASKNPDVTKQLLAVAKQHWSKSGAEMQVEVAASATAAGKSGEGQPQLLDERLQFEEWWK